MISQADWPVLQLHLQVLAVMEICELDFVAEVVVVVVEVAAVVLGLPSTVAVSSA